MASLRKRSQQNPEASRDEPPVSSPPEVTAAELPPLAADAGKPPETPATNESPAEVAARTALKQRLAEMQNAEAITIKAAQQQPPQAAEPPQQQPEIPAAVAKFLAENPRYTDPNDAI